MANLYNKHGYRMTDPALTPYERGRAAKQEYAVSMDYNEDTQEWNPYPKKSWQYREYEACYDSIPDCPW